MVWTDAANDVASCHQELETERPERFVQSLLRRKLIVDLGLVGGKASLREVAGDGADHC